MQLAEWDEAVSFVKKLSLCTPREHMYMGIVRMDPFILNFDAK